MEENQETGEVEKVDSRHAGLSPNKTSYLANSAKNKYDMYFGIYTDTTYQDELLLTQLIKPGDGLQTFKTSRKLEPGTHEAVLALTQVKEDHKTIQSFVTIILKVEGQD